MKQSGKTMGMLIASLRKAQGMTQAELAERMQVTDKAVSKWERDLSCPDIQSLPKLQKCCRCPQRSCCRERCCLPLPPESLFHGWKRSILL